MASKKKNKKKKPAVTMMDNPNRPLAGLAAAGMVLTAYLALSSWMGKPPAYCGEGSACEIVQRSRWGTFLGLPTAFWGFLTYASLLYIGIRVRNAASHWKSAWTVSLIGLSYSAYLMAVSIFVIESACLYCLASFATMSLIFGLVIFQRPKGLPKFRFPAFAGQTAVIAFVMVAGMHLHYSGVFSPASGPADPYLDGLARHLSGNNAVMYGAYW